jgi:uncharacterized protein (TIGR03435 family)
MTYQTAHSSIGRRSFTISAAGVAALVLLTTSIRSQGQSQAAASPAFEVASIKPSAPDESRMGLTLRGSEFSTINTSVGDLMKFAYDVHSRQIAGGPGWLDSARFDIVAKPEGRDRPNLGRLRVMIQRLLADRFELTFHHEQKELSVYAITIDKNGARMKKSGAPTTALPNLFFKDPGALKAKNASVGDLANALQREVADCPVVDQTALSDRFDFDLDWTPDETQPGGRRRNAEGEADPTAPPGLLDAIREQLGLRLRTTKAEVEILVIDHLEKPSDN